MVNVPVLSEQINVTEPSVSTVARDLQRILFFFITAAVMVRQVVRVIGRPSGMNATATLTQLTINIGTLIHPSCFFRSQVALVDRLEPFPKKTVQQATNQRMQTSVTKNTTRLTIITMNLRISFCRVVRPFRGWDDNFAMRPKTVSSAVPIQSPTAVPETQWVPCIAMHLVSK